MKLKLLPKNPVGEITKALPVTGGVGAGVLAARYLDTKVRVKSFPKMSRKNFALALAALGVAGTAMQPPVVKGTGLGTFAKAVDIYLEEMERSKTATPAPAAATKGFPDRAWDYNKGASVGSVANDMVLKRDAVRQI